MMMPPCTLPKWFACSGIMRVLRMIWLSLGDLCVAAVMGKEYTKALANVLESVDIVAALDGTDADGS
jgi:hypothetical protein